MLTLFKRNTTTGVNPVGEPTRATIADEQKLYDDKHPGFPQYLPWVEYLTENKCFLLEDGRSVGAVFELRPIGTEGRMPDWLQSVRDMIEDALQDSFKEVEDSPWVIQMFCQDVDSTAEYMGNLEQYIQSRDASKIDSDKAHGTHFTDHYLELMKHHLVAIAKPGGLFFDERVTKLPWRGKSRQVFLCLYRWIPEHESNSSFVVEPTAQLEQVCERLTGALAGAGVPSWRLDGEGFYNWLMPFFNPKPKGFERPADFYKAVPYKQKADESADTGLLELPFDHDFAEQLFNSEVVDKVNGGTKADAMNAGVNVARYDYFINTDVDCILASDTLTKVMLPVMDSDVEVIAVGATMRMANGCEVDHGRITRVRPPRGIIPTFQETEYLRSYLVAKMGWAAINATPNVSGGFGFFQKAVVIDAGGFDPLSHAEDMDMTLRMIAHMRDNGKPYRIAQVPETLCWTEGPPNIKVLARQRTRWGRGLLQIFIVHRKFLFNRKYGRMGLIIMPYAFFFELLAPLIEFFGFLFLLYLLYNGQVNFETFWLILGYVYLAGVTMSLITIAYDLTVKKLYRSFGEYFKLMLFSSVEVIFYHPLIVINTIRGYVQFLTRKNFKWGAMTRQGFSKNKALKPVGQVK